MKKVINIRGGHASGKTSAVREYIKQHSGVVQRIEAGKYTSDITICGNVIVLGRYDCGGCEGCDRYRGFDQMKRTLVEVVRKYNPEAVIYEGIMYSVTFKGAHEIAILCRSLGYEYNAILLERNREQQLAYMEIRNGGKNRNMKSFDAKIERARISTRKLMEAGEKVKRVDVTDMSLQQLAGIIPV